MTGFFLSTGWKAAWIGRGEKIRTSDPLHPMQVRYQAALRPDTKGAIISELAIPRKNYFKYSTSDCSSDLSSAKLTFLFPLFFSSGPSCSRRLRAPLMVKPSSYSN
jgi:hypothetical protein